MRRAAAAAGLGILLAHAALFALVAPDCSRASLRVDVATRASAAPAEVTVVGDGAGIARTEWRVRYRGGFERSVGLTELVGPFQRAADPPCGVRLHVGQAFLDDGEGSPGTLAAFIRGQLDRYMAGFSVVGLGDFLRARRVALRWSDDRGGSLRVDLALKFEDGTVPVTVHAVPRIEAGRLRWRTHTRARVRVSGKLRAAIVDWLRLQDDIDDAATGVGDRHVREVAAGIDAALAAPPPVPLGGGRELRFAYCDGESIRIVDRATATVPLALIPLAGAEPGPVHLARGGAPPAPGGAVPLALDFDLDAANATLHLLWASGALDEQIRARGVADWFNEAEPVERYLSVRIADLRLALPPTVEREAGPATPLTLAAEAALELVDGDRRTPARLFGRVGFDLTSDDAGHLQPRMQLDDLALSCEPQPGALEPCYGAVVDAARRQAPRLHGPVATAISRQFDQLLHARRFGNDLARFAPESARVTVHPSGASGWIRVAVLGQIVRE